MWGFNLHHRRERMKYITGIVLLCSVTGCTAYKKEILKREYNGSLYVTIESARIHNEPACIVGGKVKYLGELYSNALENISKK